MYETPDLAKTTVSDGEGCQLFLIEALAAPDVLLWILGQFAVRQASLKSVDLRTQCDSAHIRIEAIGLDKRRASVLASLLRGMPCVISLSWGWRSPQLTASV